MKMEKETLVREMMELFNDTKENIFLSEKSEIVKMRNQYFHISFYSLGTTPKMEFLGLKNPQGKIIMEDMAILSNFPMIASEDVMDDLKSMSNNDIVTFKEARVSVLKILLKRCKEHFLKEYPNIESIPQKIKNQMYSSDKEIIEGIQYELVKNKEYFPSFSPNEYLFSLYLSKERILNFYGKEEKLFEEILSDEEINKRMLISLCYYYRSVNLFSKAKENTSEKWGEYYRKIASLQVATLKFVYDKDKIVTAFNELVDKELKNHSYSESTIKSFENFKSNLKELPSKVAITVSKDRISPSLENWYSIYDSNAEKVLNKSSRIYIVKVEDVLFNSENLVAITYRGKDILSGNKI